MRLTIKRQDFLRLLNFAGQAVPSKSAEKQFMNFLIEVREDGVSVIASDGDISARADQPLKNKAGEDVILSAEPGLIQVPAKYLLDIVSKLGGDVITLNMVDTNFLNISDDITNFNLVTQEGEEYPNVDLNVPEESQPFSVKVSDIAALYDATSFAAATRGPKEVYFTINVRAKDSRLYFLTTDSYRMARLSKLTDNDESIEFRFNCPLKALNMVKSIAEDDICSIYYDDQKALFVCSNVTVSTRLVRGDFPSPESLIPAQFTHILNIDTDEFLAAADRVRIISAAEDKNSQVRLILTEDKIRIYAKSANYGNSEEILKKATVILPEGEEIFEIGFNVDFVTDAVKALKSKSASLCFTSPTRMFMAKSDDEENIQIMTPIRISSFSN